MSHPGRGKLGKPLILSWLEELEETSGIGGLPLVDWADRTLGDQPGLWQERVLLNEEFYRALREHPVPLSEAALRAIGPRSMVIDVYIWLAYRQDRRTARQRR